MMAGPKIRVMIVDDIAETREQLRKLLSFDPDIEVAAMVGSGEEALKAAPQALPNVVLMDINMPGMDGITATGKLMEILPAAQIIMLSVQGESDYMRRAMMAGARDFLTKPPSADELLDTIHRVYKVGQTRQVMVPQTPSGPQRQTQTGTPGTPARLGKLITVFSAKGGTGCTTIAVNLAIALQTLVGTDVKVGLVDASLQFGDVAIFMKLQPTRTLADLAPRAQELDVDLLNTILIPHPSGVKVLAAPLAPEDAEVFHEGGVEDSGANRRLKAIIEFARREFDYLIVDTRHLVDDTVLAALDLTDLVLIVTRPVIPEIRGARLFIELLRKMQYPLEKLALVINSVDTKVMGIDPSAIEKAMMPAVIHIPLDERTALRAANYGVPFIIQSPKLPIGQAMTTLAQVVHDRLREKESSPATDETQKRPGLGRLL